MMTTEEQIERALADAEIGVGIKVHIPGVTNVFAADKLAFDYRKQGWRVVYGTGEEGTNFTFTKLPTQTASQT